MQKLPNVTFASKPDYLPKFLQNSDFRPCVTCFNTQENLKPKYKIFLVLLRQTYFHVFLNASIWCRINDCVLIMFIKWASIIFADSLTIFGGILSGLVAFLGFMFLIILFISCFCSRNVKCGCWRIYVVFDVYNTTVIFILLSDIFYSSVVLIRIVRVSLDDWW